MILVNSGAFLSISSWFCELTELIFVMIPYISSTGYPPKTQGIMGHVQVANTPIPEKPEVACKRGLIALAVNSKQHGERARRARASRALF